MNPNRVRLSGMLESIKSPEDALYVKIQALYDIEDEIYKFLPRLVKKVSDTELRGLLQNETTEVGEQVKKLENCMALLDRKKAKLKVEGIRGIISDAKWLIGKVKDKNILDAALLAVSIEIDHYEMGKYINAVRWAKVLGEAEVKNVLEEILNEEKLSAVKLESMADRFFNEAIGVQSE